MLQRVPNRRKIEGGVRDCSNAMAHDCRFRLTVSQAIWRCWRSESPRSDRSANSHLRLTNRLVFDLVHLI